VPNGDHQRLFDTVGGTLSFLVSLATIVGIPVALYGYFQTKQEDRINRTYDYYRQYHDGPLPLDVNTVIVAWNAKADEVKQLLAKSDFDGLTKLQGVVAKDANVNAALARVVVFFDGVGTCVANSLCDGDTAYALLYEPAYRVSSAYGGYLTGYQISGVPFARGVFTLAGLSPPKKWWLF
jgi:hypothetical protein